MELDRELSDLIARELDALGYELVKVETFFSGRRRTISLFIDRPDEAVAIGDCVRVTKSLGLVLEGLESLPGPFNLEVSSPGFARPLTKPQHFARFRGERARVEYLDDEGAKTTAIGRIVDSSETVFTLLVDGAGRVIPFEKILKANLHPEERFAPKPEHRTREGRRKRTGKRF
jgi:ribosome maturation factor RimP